MNWMMGNNRGFFGMGPGAHMNMMNGDEVFCYECPPEDFMFGMGSPNRRAFLWEPMAFHQRGCKNFMGGSMFIFGGF